jgi:soluble lytic murein transglycosylase
MRRESRYDPGAISGARARGLMQLLPDTATRLANAAGEAAPGEFDLHDPAVNVRLGARYLASLRERFGSTLAVAAAYNAGPRNVLAWLQAPLEADEWVERIPFRETRLYVKLVHGTWAAYGMLYGTGRPVIDLGPMPAPGEGVDF